MGKDSRCERERQVRPRPVEARDRIAGQSARRRVLVAFEDVAQRIDVATSLMLAGHDVILARSLDQRAGLIGAVHVVVADGRLASGLGRRAHEALRRSIFIAVCEAGVPTPLIARVRIVPPLFDEELVTAVTMLAAPKADATDIAFAATARAIL